MRTVAVNINLKTILGLAFGCALAFAVSAPGSMAGDLQDMSGVASPLDSHEHIVYCTLSTHHGRFEGHSADERKAMERATDACRQHENEHECREGRMDCH